MVDGLRGLGLRLERPKGSFYCWACVEALPPGWNTGYRYLLGV
jgi:hypothetical protein